VADPPRHRGRHGMMRSGATTHGSETAMTDDSVALVVVFRALPGHVDALRTALLELTVATRAEDGCVRYDLHEDVNDPDVLAFYEIWATPAAHAAHDETPHVKAFVARFPELLDGAPRVNRLRQIEPQQA
jgi:quinol monooxygenase YgiN